MLKIQLVLAALLTFIFSFAQAQQLTLQEQDLTDYLSPLDTIREFGLNPDMILWKASFADPRLKIVVDKAERGTSPTAQKVFVFLDGVQVGEFKTSTAKEERVTTPTGQSYFATTPTGEYRIYARNRFHKSKKWNGAEMNFAQFFNGGIAIQATVPMHYEELGRRDSGGCVRLHPKNAEIVWEMVGKVGVDETKVYVFDGSEQPFPEVGQQEQMGDQFDRYPQPVPEKRPRPREEPRRPQPQYPQPQYPQPQPYYPPVRPTPPPPPPPGVRDTYPYCAPGYWCPYRT